MTPNFRRVCTLLLAATSLALSAPIAQAQEAKTIPLFSGGIGGPTNSFSDILAGLSQAVKAGAHTEAALDKVIQGVSKQARDGMVYYAYFDRAEYITPEQENYMFSSFKSFIWNLLACTDMSGDIGQGYTLSMLIDQFRQGADATDPNVRWYSALMADELDKARQYWANYRDINLNFNKAKVDPVIELIRKRVPGIMENAYAVRELAYNPELLDKFLSDDEWARSYASQAIRDVRSWYNRPQTILDPSVEDMVRSTLGPASAPGTVRIGS